MLSNDLRRVVHSILSELDVPRALTVKLMMDHGEWDQLVNLTTEPIHVTNAHSYYCNAIATDLLRKCKDLDTTLDLQANTWSKWLEAEQKCAQTNAYLRRLHEGPYDPSDAPVLEFIKRVRKNVRRLLGRPPRDLIPRHGPGATFAKSGGKTTVPDKMSLRPTITQGARLLLDLWDQSAWGRGYTRAFGLAPEVVRGNRLLFVPKTAKVLRPIAIEASINVAYQLGVGGVIRERLRYFGIDLQGGQSIHRQVACESSRSGEFATIDLASASDTIAYWLVKLLLPDDWFEILDTLRSPFTEISGSGMTDGKERWVRLEKFSSMGNGYTFELETALFMCIARTVMEDRGILPVPGWNLHVYGDDIIVPTEVATDVISALEGLGFETNRAKTFTSGPFRESCGGDFFDGAPVRALFIEEDCNEPSQWIVLANGIRRVAEGLNTTLSYSGWTLQRSWLRALDAIPSDIKQCRGPAELGDVVLHDVPEKWNYRTRNWIREYKIFRPVIEQVPLDRWCETTQWMTALYYAGIPFTNPDVPGVMRRGSVSGYLVRWQKLTLTDKEFNQESERYKKFRDSLTCLDAHSVVSDLTQIYH